MGVLLPRGPSCVFEGPSGPLAFVGEIHVRCICFGLVVAAKARNKLNLMRADYFCSWRRTWLVCEFLCSDDYLLSDRVELVVS